MSLFAVQAVSGPQIVGNMEWILNPLNSVQDAVNSSTPAPTAIQLVLPHFNKLNESVYELCKPSGSGLSRTSVEIVFFHGLQFDGSEMTHLTTWLSKDGQECWLPWIFKDFPEARILLISYNGCVKKKNKEGGLDMYVTSENLLQDIIGARVGQDGCPVVLVGHSLGGLVMKEVLLKANSELSLNPNQKVKENLRFLLQNVKHLFYYSCPHSGTRLAESLKGQLFKHLTTLNKQAARRNEEFRKLRLTSKWKASSVGEALGTDLGQLGSHIVVEETSVRYDTDDFYKVRDADHVNICRPASRTDASFSRLQDVIGQALAEVVNDSLIELHRPSGTPSVQVLFFHGLPFEKSSTVHLTTWECGDGSYNLWPQTWLVEEFPDAHVLVVRYSQGLSENSRKKFDMKIVVENLLSDLMQGMIGQLQGCPVVLVGHSVGGLVIKSLCLEAYETLNLSTDYRNIRVQRIENFLNRIGGIFYYGTPHHGIAHINKAANLLDSSSFKYFHILSTDAARLNSNFHVLRTRNSKWQIKGLAENLAVKSGVFRGIVVVPEASAREKELNVETADHFSISRPPSKTSRRFNALAELLHNVLNQPKADLTWDEISNVQHLPRNIVDVEDRLIDILHKLDTCKTLGLVGMGGLGKTTLAKAVFNEMCLKFEYSCFLPESLGGIFITKEEVWKHIMYHSGKKVSKEETWSQLRNKSLLLVLDNVSGGMQSVLELVNLSSSGSKLIVTSRDTDLVRRLGADLYKVPLLDEENARQLFVSHAFSYPDTMPLNLGPLVDDFVKKCQGLPLALEVCGEYLRGEENKEVWEQTLVAVNGLGWSGLSQIWATLRESYDNLYHYEQQMFLDAATFFSTNGSWTLGKAKKVWKKAYHIDRGVVSLLWQTLVDRFLVDDVEEDENVKLHELLRSLGQSIAGEPSNHAKRRNDTEWLKLLQADELAEQDVISLRPSAALSERLSAEGEDSSVLSAWVHQFDRKQGLEVSIPVTVDGRKGLEDFLALGGPNTPKHLVITNFPGSSLPGEIFQLVDLEQLEIQNCAHVEDLPDSLGQLINLRRLVILNCPSLAGVPDSLGSLRALRHLRIQDCEGLKDLPGSIGCLRGLGQLIIWNCSGLTKIPDTIGELSALRHLVIQGCKDLNGLPQSLGQLEDLEHLVVSNCPRLTEIRLLVEHHRSLKHLRIQDCESMKIFPETLKQLEALEYVTISNCSNVSTFLTACCDELIEARAPASHCEQMSTSMKSFIAALETEGPNIYLVSTEWLLNLQDHEKEMLASICMETGYTVTYQTTSNSYYERSHDHVQNTGSSNDGGRPVDNATSSGVSKHLHRLHVIDGVDVNRSSGELSSTQSGINPDGEDVDKATSSVSQTGGEKHLQGFDVDDMAGASGVSVSTETSKEVMDVRACAPKLLRVDCSASREPTERSDRTISHNEVQAQSTQYHSVKYFGACVVTLPRGDDFAISTVVEETIQLPTYQFRASGLVREDVSVRIVVETTINCCLSDDNPKKVHVKISKIRGEMKVNKADPRNHDTVLQSVRTNVWAGIIDDVDLKETIALNLMGHAKVALSEYSPEGIAPGSTTVESQGNVERNRQLGGNQALIFKDPNFPATLEGAIQRSLSPRSVLKLEIRYQLGLKCGEPVGRVPREDERHCSYDLKSHSEDFHCIIKIETRDALLS